MKQTILAINPGSTSTKIAIYDDLTPRFITTLRHCSDEIAQFVKISDQFAFRKDAIMQELEKQGVTLSEIKAVVGRGGLIYPLCSGVYQVNERMQHDLKNPPMGQHASNLGGLIAADIASQLDGVKAYIADPVVVDEMDDVARVTGHPLFTRKSIFHALNQKAIARLYAKQVGRRYEDMDLVVAHLGGGISVGAHRRGRVVDVNNALDGEGPFSPERAGTLPVGALVKACFSGDYTFTQMCKMVKGEGGFVAHLKTNDTLKVLEMAREGDEKAKLVLDAMCYNVGKTIGAMATALHGHVDAVLLTGGMAYSSYIADYIRGMVSFIAPFEVFGGEDEMGALAANALLALNGDVEPKIYMGRDNVL